MNFNQSFLIHYSKGLPLLSTLLAFAEFSIGLNVNFGSRTKYWAAAHGLYYISSRSAVVQGEVKRW